MTIAFVGGTGVSTTGAARGTTSTTVAYNNVANTRLAVLTVGCKPNTSTITTPSGWNKVGEATGGTGTNAADTGQTKVAVYTKVLDGTETGNVTVSVSGSNNVQGSMDVYSKTLTNWDVAAFVSGSDASHGTNQSAVCGTWSLGGLNKGDFAHVSHSGDTDDSTTATSAPTITQTGMTFGTVTGRSQVRNTSGNQGMTYTWSAAVTAVATPGTSNIAAPTVGFTWSVSSCGPAMVVRIREYDSFSTLTDDFPGAALDAAKWELDSGTVTVGSGVATLTTTAYAAFKTINNYQFTNSAITLKNITFPTTGNAYYAGWKIIPQGDAGNFFGMYAHGDGTLTLEMSGTGNTSVTLNATNHAFYRLRQDGTNAYMEGSPDGATWTTLRTVLSGALPAWLSWTGLQLFLEGADATDNWVVDKVNITTTPVTQTTELQWQVANQVAQTSDLRWQVANQVTQTSDVRWQVANTVAQSTEQRWLVYNTVAPTTTDLRWIVSNAITQTTDLRWAVSNQVTQTSNLQWQVANQVTKTSDIRWQVSNLVSQTSDLRWQVLNTVTKSTDLRWQVFNAVTATTDLRWLVYNLVTQTSDLRWTVLNQVTQSTDLRWQVANIVSQTTDIRWVVSAGGFSPVTQTTELRWQVANQVTQTTDVRWQVANQVTKTTDIRWQVLNAITKATDLRWQVLSSVTKTSDLRWQVLNSVAQSSDLRWQVRNLVSQSSDLRWLVYNQVGTTTDLRWIVLASTGGVTVVLWDGASEQPLTLEGIWNGTSIVPATIEIV